MEIAVLLGVVLTGVGLLGLLGRLSAGPATTSQLVVYALPLGIVAPGLAAGVGMTLGWALVAGASVFLAVLAGGLLGRQRVLDDLDTRPGAAGLNLACSGIVSLGLGAVTITWASEIIGAFSYLNGSVVGVVLVLAGVAYAIGGRSSVGLSRFVVGLVVLGAIAMVGIGYVMGDVSGLTAPAIPLPAVGMGEGLLYAVGVVLIGAGYPVMRSAGAGHAGRVVIAAVVVTLVSFATVVGVLILYGGAFQFPSLIIEILPVYTPIALSALICALLAVVSTVVAGATIHTAGQYVGVVHPRLMIATERTIGSPRLWVSLGLAAVLVLVLWLAPSPSWIVFVLAVLAVVNLLAERTAARGIRGSDKESAAQAATTRS